MSEIIFSINKGLKCSAKVQMNSSETFNEDI